MFRAWLAEIDGLTAMQRQELEAVLAGRKPRAAVAAAIEERLGEARRCPHCGGASVGGGQSDGLRRFRCKDCRRSFNALTGTPLARLRKKERWLDFGQSLSAPCAAALGVSHEALNQSKGERVRGELHIQTVNSRHESLKTFLRPHRGVATKYIDSYLRWFHLAGLKHNPAPRSCPNAAIGGGDQMVTST